MTKFTPTIGEPCIYCGNKVLYVGKGSGNRPHVFENSKGALQRFESLDDFEPVDELYDKISDICFKSVMVSNCTTMPEAVKKLYDAGMLKLPEG